LIAYEVIAAAKAAGLRLESRPGGILHVSPRERLTPAFRDTLRAAKADVLAYLRGQALGIDWSASRFTSSTGCLSWPSRGRTCGC
jgi:hypothetical protein